MKQCELYDRECIECGECDRCDLDPNKVCDSCGKCIEPDKNYKALGESLWFFYFSVSLFLG